MSKTSSILVDQHDRPHHYLRISLTDRCNFRCTYCMPCEGLLFAPSNQIMQPDEIFDIATLFVKNGVDKIRLTGGEPLVRKDFTEILNRLHTLPVELSLTTNAVLAHKYIDSFRRWGLRKINVSLDSLKPERFFEMTRRDQLGIVLKNFHQMVEAGIQVKVNCVLMSGLNDDEIIDFIELTRQHPIAVRFIEFMPFDGNQWDTSKLVTQHEILKTVTRYYSSSGYRALPLESNFTSRNYRIHGYPGSFGIISSMSNPFCSTCNRIRLTADGKLKNCLFSTDETNLLGPYRSGNDIEPLIHQAILRKKAVRAGMDTFHEIQDTRRHSRNRSMIAIGG